MNRPHFPARDPSSSTHSKDSTIDPDALPEKERSHEIYRTLFESAPDAMIMTDQQGRILDVNLEAEKSLGYCREELIGERVEKLIPRRFREVHQSYRAAYQAAPTYRPMGRPYEIVALRKDGSEFSVDISLSPVQTENGTLFYSIIRDISDRLATLRVERHLKFEQAVAGISAKFINLPANCVDQEITKGLQALAEALDADRGTIAKVDTATGAILVTHTWARSGFPQFPERILKGMLPWLEERIIKGQITNCEKSGDLPPEAHVERDYMEMVGAKSSLIVPFRVAGKVIGAMATDSFRQTQHWDDALVSRVQDIADIFANALSRKKADEDLQTALSEIRDLKEQLERENTYLREEIELQYSHAAVIGNSVAIRGTLRKAEQVALTDSAVLILGETGTGKELIARTVHDMSRRRHLPMVKVNCAALPATLIESELFGREKGAYTGALAREIGRFELADKSTIFLDEIGELPPELQSKLLRVLQEGEFERLGSSKTIRVEVRVIAATSRKLEEMVKEGKFRQDLFYRLNVFPIHVPPLRERREDIPALVWHILKELAQRMGRSVESVKTSTMRNFQTYSWPGNVRELRNVIERSLILNTGPVFRAEVPELELGSNRGLRRLDEIELEYLRNVLQSTQWRVRGRGGAAEVLGLKPTTLEAKMKKLGVRRPTAISN